MVYREKGTQNDLNLKTFKDLLKIKQFQLRKRFNDIQPTRNNTVLLLLRLQVRLTNCFPGYWWLFKITQTSSSTFVVAKICWLCIQKLIELITICAFLLFIVSLNKNVIDQLLLSF